MSTEKEDEPGRAEPGRADPDGAEPQRKETGTQAGNFNSRPVVGGKCVRRTEIVPDEVAKQAAYRIVKGEPPSTTAPLAGYQKHSDEFMLEAWRANPVFKRTESKLRKALEKAAPNVRDLIAQRILEGLSAEDRSGRPDHYARNQFIRTAGEVLGELGQANKEGGGMTVNLEAVVFMLQQAESERGLPQTQLEEASYRPREEGRSAPPPEE